MEHNTQPPIFQSAIPTTNPGIQALIHSDKLYIEKGVSYSRYVTVKPYDSMELVRNGKILNFIFKDNTSFVNR